MGFLYFIGLLVGAAVWLIGFAAIVLSAVYLERILAILKRLEDRLGRDRPPG